MSLQANSQRPFLVLRQLFSHRMKLLGTSQRQNEPIPSRRILELVNKNGRGKCSSESSASEIHKLTRAWIGYTLYSIWLFTYSDLKTIVGPKTAFGMLTALRATVFGMPGKPLVSILARLPLVALWTWINLLPFAIDNQRQPEAIEEDRLNKPWRPMPSNRMSPSQAKYLMVVLYPLAVLYSFYFGGVRQSLALILLGLWYNDLGGADNSPVVRNLINAFGFICYSAGATEVAYGSTISVCFDSKLTQWLCIIGVIVFSTVHLQDMYDQEGDSIRGRLSVPLVIGDCQSRWTIAISMVAWSFIIPWFWAASIATSVLPFLLSWTIVLRVLRKTSVKDDKSTFRLWNLWLVTLYSLPLCVGTIAV